MVVALATLASVAPAFGAGSTIVKLHGTDLFCPFDTPAAGEFLFAITREPTDGEGLPSPTCSLSRRILKPPCSSAGWMTHH